MAQKQTKRIGELLIERGLISEDDLIQAIKRQGETGGLIGELLVGMGALKEEELAGILEEQSGMKTVKLADFSPDKATLEKLSPAVARIYKAMPLELNDNELLVAISDPFNVPALDDISFMANCEVRGVIATEKEILDAIGKYYGEEAESVGDLLSQIEGELSGGLPVAEDEEEDASLINVSDLRELAEQAPVVKLLNLVLIQAVRDRASDIHFEPFEDEFKIRYRVDGVLYEMIPPPKHLSLAVTSRIKVMSNLDIAERRLPQDGRIRLSIGNRPLDLRVSTLPTVFGESVVMRVLDRSAVMLDIEQIGLSKVELEQIGRIIEKPNGIVLATGPTGSGKTTTLYSALKKLYSPEVKIITTEDPVEYDIKGIVQVQVKESIGLTFASCLRSILRQDPDIILVGEIRDPETAQMAIQSSLTGHLVLSTLHTNDAAGAIMRLIDMDVEPFLITSTVEGIIGQRLVRTICQNCKEQYEPSDSELDSVNLSRKEASEHTFFKGIGCDACRNIGYLGRTGIFELLTFNEELRRMVVEQMPTKDIRDAGRKNGMVTLRESGVQKVLAGITTIEEIVQETLGYEE